MHKNLTHTTVLLAALMSAASMPAFSATGALVPTSLTPAPVISATPQPASAAATAAAPAPAATPAITAPVQSPVMEAKAPMPACAQWSSTHVIDPKYLAKLERNVAEEKPKPGILYSQDKLVLLLAKDHAGAKAALLHKDKMEQKDGKVDLRGVDLNGFNLSGLNLDNVDLKGAELNGANLSGASLRGANLYKTEFEGANLNSADLSFTYASKADFERASMCETSLVASDLEDATVIWAYLKGAKLDRATHVPDIIYVNSDNILRIGLAVPPVK